MIFAEADQHSDDLKADRPLTMGLVVHGEAQAMLVDVGPGTGGDRGLTDELFTTIAEYQAIALDPLVEFPLLLERILDLEQVSKVGRCLHAHLEVNWLVFVIEDGHFLVEAVSDCSFANDRQV